MREPKRADYCNEKRQLKQFYLFVIGLVEIAELIGSIEGGGKIVNSLIEQLGAENWKHVVKIQSNLNNDSPFEIFIVCCEGSGTKFGSDKKLSDRNDILTFIPLVVMNFELDCIEKSEFYKYTAKHIPSTYYSVAGIESIVDIEARVLNINSDNINVSINLSEIVFDIFTNIRTFSLAIVTGDGVFIGRLSLNKNTNDLPLFPCIKMSIYSKNFENSLEGIIPNLGKIKDLSQPNPNLFLDISGSSDYDVYQSTKTGESLPSLTNLSLGNRCYSCGYVTEKLSREHCSPKWLTDRYEVKPLIGEIFCSVCNSWFGENFEKPVSELLQNTPKCLSREQLKLISNWCIKTALTMSISSGVPVDKSILPSLKRGIFDNTDWKVYFDFSVKLSEGGFCFGVSRFNKQLLSDETFLFSFASPLFSFLVVSTKAVKYSNPGLKQIYPCIKNCDYQELNNFADLYQRLHEELSGEKTIDFNLPIREQYINLPIREQYKR